MMIVKRTFKQKRNSHHATFRLIHQQKKKYVLTVANRHNIPFGSVEHTKTRMYDEIFHRTFFHVKVESPTFVVVLEPSKKRRYKIK